MYILLVFRYFLQTDRSPFRRRFQKTWEIKKITKLRVGPEEHKIHKVSPQDYTKSNNCLGDETRTNHAG